MKGLGNSLLPRRGPVFDFGRVEHRSVIVLWAEFQCELFAPSKTAIGPRNID